MKKLNYQKPKVSNIRIVLIEKKEDNEKQNKKTKKRSKNSVQDRLCVCVLFWENAIDIVDLWHQSDCLSFIFLFLFLVAVVRISFSSLFNELQLKYRHGEYRWWWWWWDEYRDFSFTHSLFLFLDNKWSLMFWSIRFLFIRFVSFFFRLMIIMNYRFSLVFFCIEGLIFSDRFFCCCFDSRLNSNGEWFFSVFFVFWCKSYIIVTWW